MLIDDVLVGQAREQSQRMAAAGVVSHDLPDSGNLQTRLANAGYSFRTVSENLARAGTVADAHDALITSPGHLRNLLSMDVTHVGIGVVRSAEPARQDLYITQIFADPALLAPPETVRQQFLARVEQSRSRSGLDPLPVDPVFMDAAMHTLLEMDGSIERDALRNLMAEAVQNLRQARPTLRASSGVAVDVQLLHDTREMKVPGHLLRQDATAFGAAAFEGRDSRNLPAVVLLSLICLD